jgi:hypothetical protein
MDDTTPLNIESHSRLAGGVEPADSVSGCPGAGAAPAVDPEALPEPPAGAGVHNTRRVRALDATVRIDPEFEAVLPPPGAAQLAALQHSLRKHGGCTNFILLWAGTDVLLDGHNRYDFCRKHNLWLWLGEIELPDRAAALDWIRKHQHARRDLSPLAASCVRGEAYNARKGTWGGDHSSAKATGQGVRLLGAAQQLADAFGVTDRTIRRDGRLAQAVGRIVANCARVKAEDGARARQALLSSDHPVTRHGIARLDGMEPDQQHKAVAYLVKNKKLPPAEQEGEGKVLLPRNAEDLVGAVIRLLGVPKAETFLKSFTAALEEARTEAAGVDEGRCRLNGKRRGRKWSA